MRGRNIATPPGQATRPTSDRARGRRCSTSSSTPPGPWNCSGPQVIDLFAGSGALGFEAISRGAEFCLFVETDEAARAGRSARTSTPTACSAATTRIHRRDATDLGLAPGAAPAPPFDLALLDPPYRQGLGERALAGLAAGD